MPTVSCPSCRQPLTVPDASRPVSCPKCKAAIPPAPPPPGSLKVVPPEWVVALVAAALLNLVCVAAFFGDNSAVRQTAVAAFQAGANVGLFLIAFAVERIRRHKD